MRNFTNIEGKTKLDRIGNTTFRGILKTKLVQHTIKERLLKWLGHILLMVVNRTTRNIYDTKKKERMTQENFVTESIGSNRKEKSYMEINLNTRNNGGKR